MASTQSDGKHASAIHVFLVFSRIKLANKPLKAQKALQAGRL
jgi:hypothetical protein